jgi:hypothetical protein
LFVAKYPGNRPSDATLPGDEYPEWGYQRGEWIPPLKNVIAVSATSPLYETALDTRDSGVAKSHLSDPVFRHILNRNLLIVLYGFVQYDDVLKREHETEFRAVYDPHPGSFFWYFSDHPKRENDGG